MARKIKKPGTGEIENTEGFLTWKGTNTYLGYLMHFKDRGTYEPNFGRVDVSKEDADIHNKLLDQAMLDGLAGCEIGQGGSFYLSNSPDGYIVATFTGQLVSDEVRVIKSRGRAAHGSRGDKVYFDHKGMKFEGYTTSDMNLLNFVRKA